MKIGRYQLENLVKQDVRFIFADLRSRDERAEFTDPLLQKAMPLSLAALRDELSKNQVPLDYPLLLLSQDGREAEQAALALEADGYKNVYSLRDGFLSLKV